MIEHALNPRFNDTDSLGHINNASVATWFEEGRTGFFRYFVPSLSPKEWNLIVARTEIDYLAQGQYGAEVVIRSWLAEIGTSSFRVYQECHQNGRIIAKGICSLVHFNYAENRSEKIPDKIRAELLSHLAGS